MKIFLLLISIFVVFVLIQACSESFPSDKQVLRDIKINKKGLIDAYCVNSKKEKLYWHSEDQTWYWDKSVVIKRDIAVREAPDASIIIQGIARYHSDGNHYSFYKFLTTSNHYEGIPSPSAKELEEFVKKNLPDVFIGRAHNIIEVNDVKLNPDFNWEWHNPKSFSTEFSINYKEIVSYNDVSDRTGIFRIRFYRNELYGPIVNLLASEKSRKDHSKIKYTSEEILRQNSIIFTN